ncbi:MAG TPA: hypothetical protein VMJ93_06775 [Verrucomicrobiae bacterium]|nr:hypothetical protein [Verrucomicrobiae bacterium]
MNTARVKTYLPAAVLASAVFLATALAIPRQASRENENSSNVRSRITVFDLAARKIRVIYTADKLWEAPNWSPDGKYLLANSGGALYRIPLDAHGSPNPEKLAIPEAYKCNNDHGITRDGKQLAFSATYADSKGSQVFVAAVNGAHPRLMTPQEPSYFHGWSPDGAWLAFVAARGASAQRAGGPLFHIFRMPAAGGPEERLTSRPVLDDGPDYSPDGKWIYFNSKRIDGWDIWRMPPDGAGANDAKAERITSDEMEDWFPHPSPDGKWLLFLSFPHGTPGHDVKTNVELRMIPMPSSASGVKPVSSGITVLAKFFGGQGTINVNSWSPDSKKFAYVSYERLP